MRRRSIAENVSRGVRGEGSDAASAKKMVMITSDGKIYLCEESFTQMTRIMQIERRSVYNLRINLLNLRHLREMKSQIAVTTVNVR